MNKKAVYLVGNSLVAKDAMPFKIKSFLKRKFPNTRFVSFDPTENFPKELKPVFIDTVINLQSPRLFTSIESFQAYHHRNITVHSFDFYTEIALRKKAGLISSYIIIGVPPKGDCAEVAREVARLLKTIPPISLLKNDSRNSCRGRTLG